MIKKLYLSGSIRGLSYEDATRERNKAAKALREIGIETLDPMRGKEHLRESKSIGNDGTPFEMQDIIARDLSDIRESDGIVVLTGDHCSWGTAIEFGFTYFKEEKPIFLISKDPSRMGWEKFLATRICSSIEELVSYLKRFWR